MHLAKIFLAAGLALAAAVPSAAVEVIAHRGASGYLPAHTLPAYAYGYAQGAHWIEPDVVLSRDGVPVALHDLTLDRTTNVAEVFAGRARDDGKHYAADFDLAELERLRVVERIPNRFPNAYTPFVIPTLEAVAQLVAGLNASTGCRVGLYPELKYPDRQPGLAERVFETLAGYDLPVLVQSFDAATLMRLESPYPLVRLLPRDHDVSDAVLDQTAAYAFGIAPASTLLFADPTLAARARARGLAVHVYTVRADWPAKGFQNLEDEVRALEALGVTAIFTDHPDAVLKALAAERSCHRTATPAVTAR